MIRVIISIVVLFFLFGAAAQAEDNPPFTTTCEATRSGDKISVSIKIVENKIEVVPGIGWTNVTTAKSSPWITLLDGRRGQISIGRSQPVDGAAPAATRPTDMDSGIRVDVISVKGKETVLVITEVVENGATAWAEAKTVKVQQKPVDRQK